MNKIKVLVVEDDSALSMVICETLSIEGFTVFPAQDGVEGLNIFANQKIDVGVADIMMPRLDGLDMVARIRQRSRIVPIIFLTAKSSVDSVVDGFHAGADDYIRKPFSMKGLIVRIRALHTRVNVMNENVPENHPGNMFIGSYSFDPVSQYLCIGDHTEILSSRESGILAMLAADINKIVPATHIMKSLWGDDTQYIANSLQVFINRLRQRLKHDPSVKIINAIGVGYKLAVDFPKHS